MAGLKEKFKRLLESEVELDLSKRVMKDIQRVRKAGEEPKGDLYSLDHMKCDLCQGKVEQRGIIQCPFCGRWICRENCWMDEEGACKSCMGIIKLHREALCNLKEMLRLIEIEEEE